jgi:3-oxoacyl-[acyl-carrier protein] reductase
MPAAPVAGRQAGRVAVVTGAARGLGRAFAEGLASEGAHVVMADIDPAVERTVAELRDKGAPVTPVRADVTRPADVERMIATAQALGRLDILVNNAGRFPIAPLETMTLEEWRSIIALNLEAVFLGIRAAIPLMKGRRYGRIVNVASTTVFHGTPGLAHYVAAKAGVIGLTRSAASELGPHGITVNAIAPGLTLTDGMRADPRMVEVAERRVPTRAVPRHSVPGDLVPALLFLAAPETDFVTGQTLSVNGGEIKL